MKSNHQNQIKVPNVLVFFFPQYFLFFFNILHKRLYFQPPLASTNYLYELDTITKDVINVSDFIYLFTIAMAKRIHHHILSAS